MIGFERTPHPLLDLTPEEQITLIKVRDEEVRMHDEAIPPLEAMGLVEYADGGLRLTEGRGDVVARYLRVLHDVRVARRRGQQVHEPKWSVLSEDYERQATELRERIEALPVNMPGLSEVP